MVVLSTGAGGRPEQRAHGQATGCHAAALDRAALNQIQRQGAISQAALNQGAIGRVAAAASLGLYFLGAAPADAAHHHHDHAESGKTSKTSKTEPAKPSGPLLLAISLGGQHVTVYDDGKPIASSRISTGMPGHPTPMGIFSVIQKQRWHRSNIYSGAPMPYMQRITWSGVALHAGVVPGYPASHGCIRLPEGFAVRLWGMTKLGARVIITRGETTPYEIDHPRLAALAKPPEGEAAPAPPPPDGAKPDGTVKPDGANDAKPEGAALSPGTVVVATTGAVSAGDANSRDVHASKDAPADSAHPESAPASSQPPGDPPAGEKSGDPAAAAPPSPQAEPAPPPAPPGEDVLKRPGQLSLFVSRREGKLYVRKGFTPAFDVPITIAEPDKPLGTHVFTASRPANDGAPLRWFGVSVSDRQPSSTGGSKHGRHRGHAEQRERPAPVTAQSLRQSAVDALDRIELPPEALARLAPLVTAGTSLVISDHGLGGETGKDTDFIVVTR